MVGLRAQEAPMKQAIFRLCQTPELAVVSVQIGVGACLARVEEGSGRRSFIIGPQMGFFQPHTGLSFY
jgi:hypothetical protein